MSDLIQIPLNFQHSVSMLEHLVHNVIFSLQPDLYFVSYVYNTYAVFHFTGQTPAGQTIQYDYVFHKDYRFITEVICFWAIFHNIVTNCGTLASI